MKKSFTKRITRQYLLGKLPENLSPGKTLKQAERKHLLKSYSLTGWRTDSRGSPLSYIIAREMERVRQTGISNQRGRWAQIDALEQGPPTDNPSLLIGSRISPQKKDPLSMGDTARRGVKGVQKVLALQERFGAECLSSSLQIRAGVAGQRRGRASPLLQQLTERRKVRILYGNLSNKEINTLVRDAKAARGEKYQNTLKLIESRLDVVLYRANLCASITIAQQWVRRGFIAVNGRIETIAARLLSPGDVVGAAVHLLPALSAYLTSHWYTSSERFGYNQSKTEPAFTNSNAPYLVPPQKAEQGETARAEQSSRKGVVFLPPVFADPSKERGGLANRSTHIEVSYRSFSLVYLCHAQQIVVPALLNMAQIQKAYTK